MAGTSVVINATAKYALGDASPDSVGSVTLQISGAGSYSILAKGVVLGNGLTVASNSVALYYKPAATGVVTAGATAITADGIYTIIADGANVVLDATYTSGTVNVDYVPLRG